MMWVTGIDAGWTEIATNFKMWDILGELDTLFSDAIYTTGKCCFCSVL